MSRLDEPGWIRIGRFCSSRRRSLWFRTTCTPEEMARGEARLAEHGVNAVYETAKTVAYFELCAGREGDDHYLRVDNTDPLFESLLNILQTARYAATES